MDTRISDIFSYGDDPVFWESCDEISPEEVKALTMRRIRTRRVGHVSRTLLIAALIVSLLTVSAIAVGLSIHAQRKENLRQMLEIDTKNVENYTEFPLPAESGEASPSVVLLSAVKDGEFETVYVSISPVEEEDLFTEDRFGWTLSDKDCGFGSVRPVYDSSKLDFTETVTDYDGLTFHQPDPEQQRQAILENYDPETKSGLFEFGLLCNSSEYDINQPLEVSIYKFSRNYDTLEVYDWQELGTIRLGPIDESCLSLRFPEPPTFENPDTGGKGRILGADIYATSISWIIQHDDMADIYTSTDGTPPRLSGDEYHSLSLSWLNALDEMFRSGAIIEYADGEKVVASYGAAYSNYDGEQVKCYVHPPETLDLSRIHSLTVLGETVYVIR